MTTRGRSFVSLVPDYRFFSFRFSFLSCCRFLFISILLHGGGAASNFIRYDLTASGIVIEVYTRIERFIGSDEVGERCHIETSDDIMNNEKKW